MTINVKKMNVNITAYYNDLDLLSIKRFQFLELVLIYIQFPGHMGIKGEQKNSSSPYGQSAMVSQRLSVFIQIID